MDEHYGKIDEEYNAVGSVVLVLFDGKIVGLIGIQTLSISQKKILH